MLESVPTAAGLPLLRLRSFRLLSVSAIRSELGRRNRFAHGWREGLGLPRSFARLRAAIGLRDEGIYGSQRKARTACA
jgi:hypothetical protein